MIRPVLFLIAVLLVFGICQAFAGGAEYEAPVVRGRCNPMVIPEDMKGEGWQWIKSHERLAIAAGDNEIRDFQTLYCREFTSTGGLVRDYVIPTEWWRPRVKKPAGKARVTNH